MVQEVYQKVLHSLKPHLDGKSITWGHEVIALFTCDILWFYCRLNRQCLCFSPTSWEKILCQNTNCFSMITAPDNLKVFQIGISEFSRRTWPQIHFVHLFGHIMQHETTFYSTISIYRATIPLLVIIPKNHSMCFDTCLVFNCLLRIDLPGETETENKSETKKTTYFCHTRSRHVKCVTTNVIFRYFVCSCHFLLCKSTLYSRSCSRF